jgi:hypothetical protein
MSLLVRLHNNNIIHAIVKSEDLLTDWYVVCHKTQLKNINVFTDGSIQITRGIYIFTLTLQKEDIFLFLDLLQAGVYRQAFEDYHSIVWEHGNVGFKQYLKSTKPNRVKIKKWKLEKK